MAIIVKGDLSLHRHSILIMFISTYNIFTNRFFPKLITLFFTDVKQKSFVVKLFKAYKFEIWPSPIVFYFNKMFTNGSSARTSDAANTVTPRTLLYKKTYNT